MFIFHAFITADFSLIQWHRLSKYFQNNEVGIKTVWFNKKLLIEAIDAAEVKVGDTVTLINWGNVKIVNIIKGVDGSHVCEIRAKLDLDNKVRNTSRIRKFSYPVHEVIAFLQSSKFKFLWKIFFGTWKWGKRLDSEFFRKTSGKTLFNTHCCSLKIKEGVPSKWLD